MKKIFILGCLLLLFTLTGCEDKTCNHEYIQKQVVEVTCTTDGYTLFECGLCNDTYKGNIVRSQGHKTYVSKEAIEATCEDYGYSEELSCSICEQVVKKQEKKSKKGHKYGTWEVQTEPTKNDTGLLIKLCANNSTHYEEKILPALNVNDYSM